jgi:GntR family transcriptional regulator, rspAB operon transcriptional repressor
MPRTQRAAAAHVAELPPERRPAREPPLVAPAPKTSLGEEAYEAIKWRILKMEIAPGTFLNVQELANALALGRSPVHYAVLRLQHDGLLEVLPRKGIVVRAWSREDIAQVVEARVPIEVHMARLAAERADKQQVRALKAVLANGPDLIAAGDREGLMRLDRELHHGLAVCTRNATIAEIQGLLHQRSTPLWFINLADRREYAQVQGEHERIVARVAAGDLDGAAAAMQVHLGNLARR